MKFKALLVLLISLSTLNLVNADDGNNDISIYTGTFDLIDKEKDRERCIKNKN